MSVTPLPNRPHGDSSPGLLLNSMQTLEAELERLMNDWAKAEQDMVRNIAEVERLRASQRLTIKNAHVPAKNGGPTKEDLDSMVLNWLWDDHEDEMTALVDAEARVAACKAIYKCAERALSSKQSRLNADLKLTPQ